jgi:large subunit ribosomal protein L24
MHKVLGKAKKVDGLEKLLKAKRRAVKQWGEKKGAIEQGEAWSRKQQRQTIGEVETNYGREARKNRQVDWQAGPLAPRRDVGEKVKTYATKELYHMNPPEIEKKDRKWSGIEKGDRVVILRGHDRGKVGYVYEASMEKGRVVVKDLNMVDIYVPEFARRQSQNPSEILHNPHWLPTDQVKLVYPLPDPKTGVPRDVIIDRLEKITVHPGQASGLSDLDDDDRTDMRVIAGTNTIIPWPVVPEESEEEEFDDDTPRITVDEVTFRPYLLYPPMPNSAIDELRNKYSKFRTRHTYEFEQKREAYAARDERRERLSKTMRTPLQELAEMRARQKAAEERQLTDEQLAKIGEVMSRGKLGANASAMAQ